MLSVPGCAAAVAPADSGCAATVATVAGGVGVGSSAEGEVIGELCDSRCTIFVGGHRPWIRGIAQKSRKNRVMGC